jgi:hypothetical protein
MIRLEHVRTPNGPLILRVVHAGTRIGDFMMTGNPLRRWRWLRARVQQRGAWSILLMRPADDPFGPPVYVRTVATRAEVDEAVKAVIREAAAGEVPMEPLTDW